jgi:hypothetical protein
VPRYFTRSANAPNYVDDNDGRSRRSAQQQDGQGSAAAFPTVAMMAANAITAASSKRRMSSTSYSHFPSSLDSAQGALHHLSCDDRALRLCYCGV